MGGDGDSWAVAGANKKLQKERVSCKATGCVGHSCPLSRVQKGVSGQATPAKCKGCGAKYKLSPGSGNASGSKPSDAQAKKIKELERKLARSIEEKEKLLEAKEQPEQAVKDDKAEEKDKVSKEILSIKSKIGFLEGLSDIGKELLPEHSQRLAEYKLQLEVAFEKQRALKSPGARRDSAKAWLKKCEGLHKEATEDFEALEKELEEKRKLLEEMRIKVKECAVEVDKANERLATVSAELEGNAAAGTKVPAAHMGMEQIREIQALLDEKLRPSISPSLSGAFDQLMSIVSLARDGSLREGARSSESLEASSEVGEMELDMDEELLEHIAEQTIAAAKEGQEENRRADKERAKVALKSGKLVLSKKSGGAGGVLKIRSKKA